MKMGMGSRSIKNHIFQAILIIFREHDRHDRLAPITWAIFGSWIVIVAAFYLLWGRRHARLNDPALQEEHRQVASSSAGKDASA